VTVRAPVLVFALVLASLLTPRARAHAEEVDVWLIDGNFADEGDPPLLPLVERALRQANPPKRWRPITYTADIITQAMAARGNGNCIKNLYIVGHASNGHIHTGSGREHPNRPLGCIDGGGKLHPGAAGDELWEDLLGPLAKLMCPDGIVWFIGCRFGAGDAGANKIWRLARKIGRRVRGPTGVIGREIVDEPPRSEGRDDPDWQEAGPDDPQPPTKKGD
jgi:hypothetical protein